VSPHYVGDRPSSVGVVMTSVSCAVAGGDRPGARQGGGAGGHGSQSTTILSSMSIRWVGCKWVLTWETTDGFRVCASLAQN